MKYDIDIVASRATHPSFYRAPYAEKEPFAFQHAAVEYLMKRPHGLLGDAPGSGKTGQAVLLGNAIEAKHTLVICPASLRLQWEREIWDFSTIENIETYPVIKSADGISPHANYVIISYALLANKDILAAILDYNWDHVILDEAHAIKDPKGNIRMKAICASNGIGSVAGRITLASGTILPNQPSECYNAIRLTNWDAIDRISLNTFMDWYYDYGEGFITKRVFDRKLQKWVMKATWSKHVRNVPINLDDLQYRLRKHIMVRRTKDAILPQLPPKLWSLFPLIKDAAINRALKHPAWQQAEKLFELNPDHFSTDIPIVGDISTARRLLGEAKAPAVVEYVVELIKSGINKIVVSAWHLSVLGFMRHEFTYKHHYGVAYMDGSTSAKRKQEQVDLFMDNDDIEIILGQMLPLGEGWNLTVAHDVILAEPFWTPGKNDQLFDRIHRIGTKADSVTAHVPVVPDTLDERILGTAVRKGKHIHLALDAVD